MVNVKFFDTFLLPKTANSVEEMQKVKLSDSLCQNIVVLKYIGYWPPKRESKYYVPYWIYTGCQFVSILLMWNVTQFVQFYFIADDLEQVAASLYIITCTGLEIIKAFYFLKNCYTTSDVVDSLNRDIFKPKNIAQYNIVAKVLRMSQFTYITYKSLATVTVFFWATYPVYDVSENRKLPFNAWFPWNYLRSPAYELCYTYQVLGCFLLAWLNITIDTTASGLMSNICAQLDMLSHKLVHLYEDTELRLKENKGAAVTQKAIFEAMYVSLEECVLHHKNILELAEKVGSVFNVNVFFQFFVSAAILCMAMFRLTLVHVFSFEFFSLIFYQICIFLEVAMYCWFGNEVILKSEKVAYAAFSTAWVDCSPKFKQNLLFLMTRLSKPLRIYAGGFFVLSVETFTLIVRSSWSYFAVLRQVHSD